MRRRVLVIDDEAPARELVAGWLRESCDVLTAADPEEGLRVLLQETPDVAIVDVVMPGGGGLRFVEEARRYLPGCAIVGMSGQARPEQFVSLFRKGMGDFLAKPFTAAELSRAITRAIRVRALRDALARAGTAPPAEDDAFASLVGESDAWTKAVRELRKAASTSSGLLLVGPTGTGKDLAARCVHGGSDRRDRPLVVVSCGALPESLLEVELFGHVAGAFTGAATARAGRFEEARGGTIVLAELGAMPLTAQARLLRVLDAGAVQRVGDSEERPTDARVIATCSRDPWDDVKDGRMRADIAHRLDHLRVDLPPLRERGDDLLLLARHLLDVQGEREQRRPKVLSPAAVRRLRDHEWPGNVRELSNVLERASIVSGASERIEPKHLALGRLGGARLDPADWPLPEEGLDLPALLTKIEDDLVAQAMERAGGHHARAAGLLRIGRASLERRLGRRAGGGQTKAAGGSEGDDEDEGGVEEEGGEGASGRA